LFLSSRKAGWAARAGVHRVFLKPILNRRAILFTFAHRNQIFTKELMPSVNRIDAGHEKKQLSPVLILCAKRFLQRGGNLPLLVRRDAVKERQGQRAPGNGLSKRERGPLCTGLPSLHMDGSKVAPGCDAALGQGGLYAVAICIFRQANHVDKPTDVAAGK
jgi:hypothetical protein